MEALRRALRAKSPWEGSLSVTALTNARQGPTLGPNVLPVATTGHREGQAKPFRPVHNYSPLRRCGARESLYVAATAVTYLWWTCRIAPDRNR